MTSKGLYCPTGNFFIDPKSRVENAVVTHAHSDHARKGSQQYYCTTSGVSLLKARLGQSIAVQSYAYGEQFLLGNVKISFHPAGHILGSSQVRLEFPNETWVVSGDYKREVDPTCAPFEQLTCDVFVTEATFGTPTYCWNKGTDLGQEMFDWWQLNAKRGQNSVIFAYSLGKTQRILSLLSTLAQRPIYCSPTAKLINECYRAANIDLGSTICLSEVTDDQPFTGELIVAPHSFMHSGHSKLLGKNYRTAFASGWMQKNHYGYSKGFLLSDHADWNDLLFTIQATQAKRVYVQHRGNGALVNKLNSLGIAAFSDTALLAKNPAQLELF